MRAEQTTKLWKPRRKMKVEVSAAKTGVKTGNYYWPSHGDTFVAVSFVFCDMVC